MLYNSPDCFYTGKYLTEVDDHVINHNKDKLDDYLEQSITRKRLMEKIFF
jgi:hypothetical protein